MRTVRNFSELGINPFHEGLREVQRENHHKSRKHFRDLAERGTPSLAEIQSCAKMARQEHVINKADFLAQHFALYCETVREQRAKEQV